MERGGELMELNRTAFKRNEAVFDRNTQTFDEHAIGEAIPGMAATPRRSSRRTNRAHSAIVRRLDDLSQESRAQREALLALIDRFPPPAQAA
jgi:hypothetical protein